MTNYLKMLVMTSIISCSTVSINAQEPIPTCPMTHSMSLNGIWQFKYIEGNDIGRDSLFKSPAYDASDWQGIRVPGNWEIQGFDTPVYDGKLTPGFGLYRQAFELDNSWNRSMIFIAFEGVENSFTFYINSKKVGTFNSAFNKSMFDISKYLNYGGLNMIAVKVGKTESPSYEFDTNDDWSLSGISRNVTLYAIPVTHFEDITVETLVDKDTATVNLNFKKFAIKKNTTVTIDGQLVDAKGNIVASFQDLKGNTCSMKLDKFHPWTAETPYLYTLQLQLKENGRAVQNHLEYVGIRQITWDNAVLKVNGVPVKLRGVNHHDESPFNGRAMNETEIRQDLMLMKKANINMIRTSHYPPAEKLIELCDSMGFYVICEVPFGYGDRLLNKPQMLDVLKQRAYYTVKRDKNHPSVIIWSVGNENPVTENGLTTGQYVHELDPTRPYLFPSTHRPFNELLTKKYDFMTMYSCHYPLLSELRSWPKQLDHALVNTEYAHALGTDLGQLQDIVDEWYNSPKLAGGAVWEFADQGIQRVSMDNVDKEKPTEYTWLTPSIYYDTESILGTDGIMYADRTPQTDYWQVRKVYSPVQVRIDQKDDDNVILKFLNRFDFRDLSSIKGKLELYADNKLVNSEELPLKCAPRNTLSLKISKPNNLPPANFHYYKIVLSEKDGEPFYEKTVRLNESSTNPLVEQFINPSVKGMKMKAADVEKYIKSTIMARVGRKTSMSERATLQGNQGTKHHLWTNKLIPCTKVKVDKTDKTSFRAYCEFLNDETQYVDGTIDIEYAENGVANIRYELTAHGEGESTECGLSIKTNQKEGIFRWIGNGPYASYPGKNMLSDFGVWQLTSNDLYFPGNREDVECAFFTSNYADGFVIVPETSKNIAIERYPEGIVISHNTHVAGQFNKNIWPEKTIKLDNAKISGAFTLIPQTSNWPVSLQNYFGAPTEIVKSFTPFYHSYDQ